MSSGLVIAMYIAVMIAGIAGFFGIRYVQKQRLLEQLQLRLLLVRLPTKQGAKDPKENDPKKTDKDEILLSEQLLGSLAAFKKPFVFEVAVPYVGEEIHFYVAVPANVKDATTRQIQALWHNADVSESDDYNIFNNQGMIEAGWLKQKDHPALPIRTYQEVNGDTFLPLLGGLAKVNEVGEGAAIQVIARPARNIFKKSIKSMHTALKKGEKVSDVLRHPLAVSGAGLKDMLKVMVKGRSGEEDKEKEMKRTVDEGAVKAFEMKLSKPLFEVNIRVITSAPTQMQAESIASGITAGFSQFTAPERNEFKLVKPRNIKEFVYQYSFREFNHAQTVVLNSEELASIFHFPTTFTVIPRIKYLKAKESAPPADLVEEGVALGASVYRSEKKSVHVTDEDRRRHIYIIGQTGTGKTNLIVNMAADDIKRGKGIGIIDPHGDLVDNILGLVPKERFEDVIVFSPADLARPLGLNMLEYDMNRPEEKTFIVNEMQGIFNKLFSQETMGPMFEQYMRNALLLLMEDMANEPATLMEVARVFTDEDWREKKLERIMNPTVVDFWQKEAVRAGGEAALSNMTPYITSKFNNFTANDYIRPIIGQTKSAFNFRSVMDEGKILLVNLSKGKIGDINANLLGMIIVGKLLMAALGRVDIPQEERKDFNLYIDEFQNFTTDSISTILSEARKYRLNLTIAHQFIAQLNEKIRDSVFGNVGSTVAFRVGAPDTENLIKLFTPEFNEHDLMNIDNGNAYVKLLMRGQPVKPFNIKIPRAPAGNNEQTEHLKELSRLKYGKSRPEIEEEVFKRLRE